MLYLYDSSSRSNDVRRVVDRVEHSSVFHQYQAIRDSVQDPIAKALRRKFFLGYYRDQYCKECGSMMEFIIDRGDKCVEAAFICRPCGGKEHPKYVNWGQGI